MAFPCVRSGSGFLRDMAVYRLTPFLRNSRLVSGQAPREVFFAMRGVAGFAGFRLALLP